MATKQSHIVLLMQFGRVPEPSTEYTFSDRIITMLCFRAGLLRGSAFCNSSNKFQKAFLLKVCFKFYGYFLKAKEPLRARCIPHAEYNVFQSKFKTCIRVKDAATVLKLFFAG